MVTQRSHMYIDNMRVLSFVPPWHDYKPHIAGPVAMNLNASCIVT
jgi:hypothetical protein